MLVTDLDHILCDDPPHGIIHYWWPHSCKHPSTNFKRGKLKSEERRELKNRKSGRVHEHYIKKRRPNSIYRSKIQSSSTLITLITRHNPVPLHVSESLQFSPRTMFIVFPIVDFPSMYVGDRPR